MIDLRYGRDCLESLREMADGSVHCCVTSPPYWGLRDYGTAEWVDGDPNCKHESAPNDAPNGNKGQPCTHPGRHLSGVCRKCGAVRFDRQIGLEPTPDAYVEKMVEVFREVRRVLRDDGTLWLNVGDSYAASTKGSGGKTNSTLNAKRDDNGDLADDRKSQPRMDALAKFDLDASGLKPKDLCLIPWRLALALQADGWWCRSVICWAKKSPMPESVTDRPTNSWEPIFLLAKSQRYFYDAEAVREPAIPQTRTGKVGYKCPKDVDDSWASGQRFSDKSTLNGASGDSRNQRNVWHLGPEPYAAAHFATFPSEIPRRAILAGTSARGCCPRCLAPWVRIVESKQLKRERPNKYTKRTGDEGTGNSCANDVAGVEKTTVGWSPSCTCPPHDPIACRVLDPFSGSATTGQVAFSLGRDYIGLDLSTEYLELARERCGGLFCIQ